MALLMLDGTVKIEFQVEEDEGKAARQEVDDAADDIGHWFIIGFCLLSCMAILSLDIALSSTRDVVAPGIIDALCLVLYGVILWKRGLGFSIVFD